MRSTWIRGTVLPASAASWGRSTHLQSEIHRYPRLLIGRELGVAPADRRRQAVLLLDFHELLALGRLGHVEHDAGLETVLHGGAEAHGLVGLGQCTLVPLQRRQGHPRHALGNLHDLGLELGLGENPVDEAQAERLVGGDDVAGVDQLAAALADDPGHGESDHTGGEAGLDDAEARVVGGVAHVAHLGEFEGTGQAIAADHGDHRFRATPRRIGVLEVVVESPASLDDAGLTQAHGIVGVVVEVVAGRERLAAGPGDNNHAHLVVGVGHGDGGNHFPAQFDAHGVHPIGPVEGDDRDPVIDLIGNGFVCHRGISPNFIFRRLAPPKDRKLLSAITVK